MAKKPKSVRERTRVAAIASALGVAALSVGAFVVQRIGDEGADIVQSGVDATRFAVEVDYPGDDCDYIAAAGWSDAPDSVVESVPAGESVIVGAVSSEGAMTTYGFVRLHFTLPTTADLTTIDVRDVQPRIVRRTDEAPIWTLGPDGCGAGQYSRDYRLTVQDASVTTGLLDDQGRPIDTPFEPFTVAAGESVFLDYELLLCDAATYELQFGVTYKPDSGDEATTVVPKEPFKLTGLPPQQAYVYGLDGLIDVPPEETFFSPSCESST